MSLLTDKTMRGKIAAAVLLGINNTWELGDQALASEITRAILALKVAGVPLSELIEKAKSGKLMELDDDQAWPSVDTFDRVDPRNYKYFAFGDVCEDAFRDAAASGFRRVKVKG